MLKWMRVQRSPFYAMASEGAASGSTEQGGGDAAAGGDAAGGEGAGGEAEVTRPDYVPEKFWDPEGKQVRTKEAFQSYTELERKLGSREDDIRNKIKGEIEAERTKGVPESPDKYELSIPQEYSEIGAEIDEADPLLGFFREEAHRLGLSNERFNETVVHYLDSQLKAMPDAQAELEKLGDTGKLRCQAVGNWARMNFKGEELSAIEMIGTTAAGVQALEKLMQMAGTGGGPIGGDYGGIDGGEQMSVDDLRAMQDDPRYWDPARRDNSYVRKVDKGFEKLYGVKRA